MEDYRGGGLSQWKGQVWVPAHSLSPPPPAHSHLVTVPRAFDGSSLERPNCPRPQPRPRMFSRFRCTTLDTCGLVLDWGQTSPQTQAAIFGGQTYHKGLAELRKRSRGSSLRDELIVHLLAAGVPVPDGLPSDLAEMIRTWPHSNMDEVGLCGARHHSNNAVHDMLLFIASMCAHT